jgi:hypothetical protein
VAGDEDDLIAPHRHGVDWHCQDCREAWPCVIFRRRLRTLYHGEPEKITTFMGHFRDRAAVELPDLTPEQIEARFLGWINESPDRRLRLRSI